MSTDGPLTTRDRLLVLAVPALLVAVAGLQLWRAHTLDQSSWSGAGFGMFATVDNEDTRAVRVTLLTPGGPEPVDLAGDLADRAHRLRVLPDGAAARRLAADLAARDWDVPVDAVEVEVVGLRFDDDRARLTTFVLASARAEVGR